MDMKVSELKSTSFTNSGKHWTGNDFLGSVYATGLSETEIKLYTVQLK